MSQPVRKAILAALLIIALVLGGKFLYRHFVTDQITDWGGMENPCAQTYTNQED